MYIKISKAVAARALKLYKALPQNVKNQVRQSILTRGHNIGSQSLNKSPRLRQFKQIYNSLPNAYKRQIQNAIKGQVQSFVSEQPKAQYISGGGTNVTMKNANRIRTSVNRVQGGVTTATIKPPY